MRIFGHDLRENAFGNVELAEIEREFGAIWADRIRIFLTQEHVDLSQGVTPMWLKVVLIQFNYPLEP